MEDQQRLNNLVNEINVYRQQADLIQQQIELIQASIAEVDALFATLDDIEAQKMYRIVIESNNGDTFKNNDVNCTLTCHVYSWDDEITETIDESNFIWTRKTNNSDGDAVWNANHSTGTKSITITSSDTEDKTVFYCSVNLPTSD